MVDKLLEIKEKNRFLYYFLLFLLLVPILFVIFSAFFSPYIRTWLANSAQKLLKNSIDKDQKLKEDINNLNNKVNDLDQADQKLKDKIEDLNKIDDANWHKKDRK